MYKNVRIIYILQFWFYYLLLQIYTSQFWEKKSELQDKMQQLPIFLFSGGNGLQYHTL